jgi:hypothetical protein
MSTRLQGNLFTFFNVNVLSEMVTAITFAALSNITMTMSLRVVPPARLGYRSVLTIEPPETRFFWGFSHTDLLCGHCHTMLAQAVNPRDLEGKLLKCNNCQSVNEVCVV